MKILNFIYICEDDIFLILYNDLCIFKRYEMNMYLFPSCTYLGYIIVLKMTRSHDNVKLMISESEM